MVHGSPSNHSLDIHHPLSGDIFHTEDLLSSPALTLMFPFHLVPFINYFIFPSWGFPRPVFEAVSPGLFYIEDRLLLQVIAIYVSRTIIGNAIKWLDLPGSWRQTHTEAPTWGTTLWHAPGWPQETHFLLSYSPLVRQKTLPQVYSQGLGSRWKTTECQWHFWQTINGNVGKCKQA